MIQQHGSVFDASANDSFVESKRRVAQTGTSICCMSLLPLA